jgi:hypothetical protein
VDISGYADAFGHELARTAESSEEASRAIERLLAPLDAALHLLIQDVVSDVADEISSEMSPGSVELRLRGRDISFVVTMPTAPAAFSTDEAPDAHSTGPADAPADTPFDVPVDADQGMAARITFRPPEALKVRIEQAAEREGLSVNTFLIRTITTALQLSRAAGSVRPPAQSHRGRFTGWVG